MKNYKYVIPVALFLILGLSFFKLYSDRKDTLEKYNACVEEAREYRELGVIKDAGTKYDEAINLLPSVEIYIEKTEMYIEANMMKQALETAKITKEKYDDDSKAYDCLMKVYLLCENYQNMFLLKDEMEKKKFSSDYIDKVIEDNKYCFFFSGQFEDVGIYTSGVCPFYDGDNSGYVDLSGKIVFRKDIYEELGAFVNDLSPVKTTEGEYYFIDKDGDKKKVLTGIENPEGLTFINQDMFGVMVDGYWGFYNLDNEYLFGKYSNVSSVSDDRIAVYYAGQWEIVNTDGESVNGEKYSRIVMDERGMAIRNNRYFAKKGDNYYLYDTDGNKVVEDAYEDAVLFNDGTYAAVQIDDKWGFINVDGEVVIEPQYDEARSFLNGYAAVKIDGKWGFIDNEGNIVIEPQFKDAKDFNSQGGVFVIKKTRWELLRLYKDNHER